MKAWLGAASRAATSEGLGGFLIRALAGTGAVRLASMGASFLVGVQLARYLGVSGYGYYGIALSIITLASIPGELGIPRLVTREVAAAAVREDRPHLFGVLRWADKLSIRLSAFVALGLVIAAAVIAWVRPSPLALALVLGAPVVPFVVLSRVRGGALQGLHHIVRGQIPANLARPLVQSALLALMWMAGLTLTPASAMAINSIGCAAAFALAAYWLRRRLPAAAPPEIIRSGRSWLSSSIPMAAADGMRILQSELTILLLGLVTGAAQVGLFRVAAATASSAATAIPIVTQVAFPTIARLYAKGEMERLQKAVTRLAQAQFVGVLVLTLPLIIVPGPLLRFAFGHDFGDAAQAVVILCVGQLINAAFGPNAPLLTMTGHERRVTRAMALALAATMIAVTAFGRGFGSNGAAWGVLTGIAVWNIVTWLDARRLLGIDTSIRRSRKLSPRTAASGQNE